MKEKCVTDKDSELIRLLNLLFRTIFYITTWSSLSLSLSLSTGLISCVVQILISLYLAEPRSEPPKRVLLDIVEIILSTYASPLNESKGENLP